MSEAFEQAHSNVSALVEDYLANADKYRRSKYQETEVRQDFIDKFFIALGWDVTHEEQKNPYAQEVKVERSITGERGKRKVDYSFALAPDYEQPRFLVEAKKPSSKLENQDFYFQTIRYGWNSGVPVSVLTNFEQFFVVDCRFKPNIDTVLDQRLKAFHCTDFQDEESFAYLYYLLSREAVADGQLQDYVDRLERPPGTAMQTGLFKGGSQPIDEAFLDDLSDMRLQLARAFLSENEELSDEEVTEATQRTLDRLVFMRFLEDRLIEPDPIVSELGSNDSMWEDFKRTCRRLNVKYNGLVFREHFTDGESFEGVASQHFRDVVTELSHHNSPYDFSALPIHILGYIYERFLGNTITVTDDRASIDPKPLVREAGGVYYTPQYIVRRIVERTIVPLIEDKTPKQILKLRLIDISCGSGSFLITTFDVLLKHITRWYQEHPGKAEKAGCKNVAGRWVLSLRQKRQILTSCIYGVDIDFQAVEVAQLSLYLKLLEDETTATANEMQALFKEQILPDLSSNIVGGNSLISYDEIQGNFFSEDEDKISRINPMDFDAAFPSVMRKGGFDAIVGNPPYVRIQTLRKVNPQVVNIYNERYAVAGEGNYDIYTTFVERGLQLLNEDGKLGYILPHKFFNAQYGRPLRRLLANGNYISEIVHFGDQQIFDDATTYTCLLYLDKSPTEHVRYVEAHDLGAWANEGGVPDSLVPASELGEDSWTLLAGPKRDVYERLAQMERRIKDVTTRIAQGIRTSANTVYVLDVVEENEETVVARSKTLGRTVELERGPLHRFLKGREIKPFRVLPSGKVVIIPYELDKNLSARLIPEDEFEQRYPLVWEYLSANKEKLEGRESGKMKGPGWHGYVYPKNLEVMHSRKILVPDTADRASFALDPGGIYAFTSGYGITVPEDSPYPLEALLGLLNSDVLAFYARIVSTELRGGFYRYFTQFIEQLPVPEASEDEIARLGSLSGDIHDAYQTYAKQRTDRAKETQKRRLDSKRNDLNELAFDLYGVSPSARDVIREEVNRD